MAKTRKRRRSPVRPAQHPPAVSGVSRAAPFAALALVLLLAGVAYAPAFDNTFVYWDDQIYVLQSDLMRPEQTGIADVFRRVTLNNYHPLTTLSWRLQATPCPECFFAYDARKFVGGNVLLHLANTVLVFLLSWRLAGRNAFVGFFSAALFALHPMHVESVAWISERKDLLYVFFLLVGLLCWDRHLEGRYVEERRAGGAWVAGAFAAFLLACLSKSAAVVFPVLLLLLDFWRNPAEPPLRALRETAAPRKLAVLAPFFAVALGVGVLTLDVQGGGDFFGLLLLDASQPTRVAVNAADLFSLWQRIEFAAYGFCTYLLKLVAPTGLSPWHPYPIDPSYGPTTLAALAILAGAAWSLRRGKLLAFGLAFFLVAIAPVLQFVSVGVAIIAERYTYLPYVGLGFAIAVGLSRWADARHRRNRAIALYALTAVLACAWASQSRQQVDVWQDSETLWTRVIERYPEQSWPYETRADYYSAMADYWVQVPGGAERALDYAEKTDADRAVVRSKQLRLD